MYDSLSLVFRGRERACSRQPQSQPLSRGDESLVILVREVFDELDFSREGKWSGEEGEGEVGQGERRKGGKEAEVEGDRRKGGRGR